MNNQKYDKPLYVGSAKEIKREGKEPIIKVELDLTSFEKLFDASAHSRTVGFRDGSHMLVSLIVAPLKTENQTKYRTHSVKIDTWKKDVEQDVNQDNGEDVPF